MDLSRFDAKQFAVVVQLGGAARVFRGAARYESDSELGAVLKIIPESDGTQATGNPVFVLQEDSWTGRLRQDDRYGCDYRLEVGSPRVAVAG